MSVSQMPNDSSRSCTQTSRPGQDHEAKSAEKVADTAEVLEETLSEANVPAVGALDDILEETEEAQLATLATGMRDQDELERDIGRQADQLLLEQADERDQKRLDKTQKEKDRLQTSIRILEHKLNEFGNHATKTKLRAEVEHYKTQIKRLDGDLVQIQKRIDDRHNTSTAADGPTSPEYSSKRLPSESQREFLIRTGKITPFSRMGRQLLKMSSSLGDVLMDAEEEEEEEDADRDETEQKELAVTAEPRSHRDLLAPGFDQEDMSAATSTAGDTDGDAALARRLQEEEYASERPAKRRRQQTRPRTRAESDSVSSDGQQSDVYTPGSDEDETVNSERAVNGTGKSDSEAGEDDVLATTPGVHRRSRAKWPQVLRTADAEQEDLAGIDDGNEEVYQSRLQSWARRRSAARKRHQQRRKATVSNDANAKVEEEDNYDLTTPDDTSDTHDAHDTQEEWLMPHPNRIDAEFEGGFRIPGDIYPSLFDYQKTGVQWLWELYSQQVGGIIGDEMGLGKTIQVISFLAGLHYSNKLTKPVIVVCPATVMKQWVNEFHRWWPPLRVSILHTSGSGMLDVRREARIEDDLEDVSYARRRNQSKGHQAARRVVNRVIRDGHVLVTTYSGLQTYSELLIPTDWEYAVLDEGHKIRNPNTAITIYCKELRTHNRIILSGTPMQNNLQELWSLFDFIFPMRLGTLINFKSQFEIPIKHGGYANASNLQVETAMRCAETLKDTISPYLLQRFKVDVAADLPKKSERVLFCKLTTVQRNMYEWFLGSEEMNSIMSGKRQALYGVDILRKICNHPDLTEHKTLPKKAGYAYGSGSKSGKMQVVKALLEIWKRNGHKTLLFAQHRIMLDILEKFVAEMSGFKYRRMDGNTSIKDRQDLVDEFNRDPNLHVFLLTTKVGGLGVNLTGADRVIIYDPDWNPSTDVQARERAWRLGQKKEVEIYRLMTAGTIEEKIYHRQIFKQFLTNKILKDPKQRQTFHLRDLHDLFTLGESKDGETETGSLFKGTEVKLSGSTVSANQDGQSLPTPPDDATNDRGNEQAAVNDIAGLSRQEEFRSSDNTAATSAEGRQDNSRNKDDRMLSSIFARTGVQSALEHDAIINGRPAAVRADPAMIQREAKRVAAEAARELQRAGEIARALPAGVPTWTGQFGSAGRPPSPPRRGGIAGRGGRGGGGGGRGGGGSSAAGPSSASVLANLAARQLPTPATTAASSPASRAMSRAGSQASARGPQPRGKDFLALIRDYLVAQGGAAYTQMLIDHFNRFCGSTQRTAEFKEMLTTIAVLEKGGRGRGRWVLKDEYRPRNEAS